MVRGFGGRFIYGDCARAFNLMEIPKKIICDVCKKEIEKGGEITMVHPEADTRIALLDVCARCVERTSEFIATITK